MDINDNKRHEREMNATLEQIRAYKNPSKFKLRIDIPIWRLAIEGITTFLLAFIVGMGLAVLYNTIIL